MSSSDPSSDPIPASSEEDKKTIEIEARLLEQEHRKFWILKNFYCSFKRWEKSDPRRIACLTAFLWMFVSPGVVAAGAAGTITIIFLVWQTLLLKEQTARLSEQNALLRTQNHVTAINQEFEAKRALAESHYQEISQILLNLDSTPSAQAFALQAIPEAMRMGVPRVDRFILSTNRDGAEVPIAYDYPNVTRLRTLLLRYMKMDRVGHVLSSAGIRLPRAEHAISQEGLNALLRLKPASTELFLTLHRLGPANSIATDEDGMAVGTDTNLPSLWRFDPNNPARTPPPRPADIYLKAPREYLVSLQHLEGEDLSGLQAPSAFHRTIETELGPMDENSPRYFVVAPKQLLVRNAHLENANFESARLPEADMQNSHFENAKLNGASLPKANMMGAFLAGAELNGIDASGGKFATVKAKNAQFIDSRFHGAVLARGIFEGAVFKSAILKGAIFNYSDSEAANFDNADLRGTWFLEANLRSASFIHARMQWSDMTGAALLGALFFNSKLEGATLAGCAFGFQDGVSTPPPLSMKYQSRVSVGSSNSIAIFKKSQVGTYDAAVLHHQGKMAWDLAPQISPNYRSPSNKN